ncbi:hypothetical protein TREES_T100007890 [Tupaia chinensis]|uniref:Uncharacterized protein n=1 Tax=Tupaia chinensis TaxID=246437 RepID=L9JDL5_TUPCH|nr:hypothetical protein TREES_T100007890 [Tupaia chinensis]
MSLRGHGFCQGDDSGGKALPAQLKAVLQVGSRMGVLSLCSFLYRLERGVEAVRVQSSPGAQGASLHHTSDLSPPCVCGAGHPHSDSTRAGQDQAPGLHLCSKTDHSPPSAQQMKAELGRPLRAWGLQQAQGRVKKEGKGEERKKRVLAILQESMRASLLVPVLPPVLLEDSRSSEPLELPDLDPVLHSLEQTVTRAQFGSHRQPPQPLLWPIGKCMLLRLPCPAQGLPPERHMGSSVKWAQYELPPILPARSAH